MERDNATHSVFANNRLAETGNRTTDIKLRSLTPSQPSNRETSIWKLKRIMTTDDNNAATNEDDDDDDDDNDDDDDEEDDDDN